jgi:hypothetical protein
MPFFRRDRVTGLLVYPLGDLLAQLILHQFSLGRTAALALAGSLIYAEEIPRWFSFIERRTRHWFLKTVLALLYFNPVWIARHLFFIAVGEDLSLLGGWDSAGSALLTCLQTGLRSFIGAVVLSLIGNYLIQNVVSLRHRFLASAVFSGLMALYYAVSVVLFR